MDIQIPENYPFVAPGIKFITKIWHPNVSSDTGYICLDILQQNWSASLTIKSLLMSIQSLLNDPGIENPLDAVVAYQYKNNYDMYVKTAKHWTNVYAGSLKTIQPDLDTMVQQLVKKGYDIVIIYLGNNFLF
jgi:ubiquitin-conjugating enzyme (huntingtin interacting protein 2)